MGNYWLHDLPGHLRNRGIPVGTYPGWETRSRSSGGLEQILAVGTHHDASPAGTPIANRLAYAWNNAASRPIGNAWILKNGTVMFGAAGATNTQGRSERDIHVSKGVIPRSKGNLYMISFEAENNGVGEVWPLVQLQTYEAVVAATCELYDLNPIMDVLHHWQYTNRKIDPFGPTVGRDYGPQKWTEGFQTQVSRLTPRKKKMEPLDVPLRIFDSRDWGGPFKKGVHTMPLNAFPQIPANAQVLYLTVTAVPIISAGYVTLWNGRDNSVPKASNLNYAVNPVANTTMVKLHNRSFKIFVPSNVDLVFDVIGYQL